MPRHIRSVTARRARRIIRPVKNARSASTDAISGREVELFHGLRQAFQATPEITETTERTLERYVCAIESLADYLEDIGAEAVWINRIDELGWALEDLVAARPPETAGSFCPAYEVLCHAQANLYTRIFRS